MMITRELLVKRLEDLEAELAQVKQQLEQAKANVNAYEGAIQDVKYWIAEWDKGEGEEADPL
jgi:phage shock protein A